MKWVPTIVLTALLFLSANRCFAAGPEQASEQPDTSGWQCALCPYRYGWYGSLRFGPGWVSDASNRFADYRGLDEEGLFPALDGNAHYRSEMGTFADLEVVDLGTDARALSAHGGQRGRYTIELGYSEIPKYRGYGTETVYSGAGSSTLTLPGTWQPGSVTTEMSLLRASLAPVALETSRKIFDAGLRLKISSNWSYEAQYQHQSKQGTRPFGAGVFTLNASHLPAPVDFSTNRLLMNLNFSGRQSHWQMGLSGSSFRNANNSFSWQNPFIPIPGTETLRASLAPDNRQYQLHAAGAWSPGSRLRFSASGSIGRMEQDDDLLPYSINPNFADMTLPRLTADTRIDASVVNLAGRMSARLARRLDLTARIRLEDRDNRTPVDNWIPVITDLVQRPERPNRPYSFSRETAELTLRYRLRGLLRLQTGAEWVDFERTLQAVEDSTELAWFAEAAFNRLSFAEIRLRFKAADRDADPFQPAEDFSLPEHPLLRKFNLADRSSDEVRVDLDFFPTSTLTASLGYRSSSDDYDESIIGLLHSDQQSLSLDLGWHPAAHLSAYAFASRDEYDSQQSGAESSVTNPWLASSDDLFLSAGLGLTVRIGERSEISLDYLFSRAEGDVATGDPGAQLAFPELESTLRNTRLWFEYRATESWLARLYLEHENFDSSDWALDGYDPDGIPAILSFGARSPDYSVTVVRAQASYQF